MSTAKIINILFFALGIASCLYLIISIIIRNIKKNFEDMKTDLIRELKDLSRGNAPHASTR